VCEWQGCETAERRFRDSHNLTNHVRYKHTGERPFSCDKPGCDKKFVQVHHMKKHSKLHIPSSESEKESSAKRKAEELNTETPNTSPSTHTYLVIRCQWKNCDEAFEEIEKLGTHLSESHIKIQKIINRANQKHGFVCEWKGCARDYPFPSCYNLIQHVRFKHTGEKPFVCTASACSLRFSQASDLKEHLRRHQSLEGDDSKKRRTEIC